MPVWLLFALVLGATARLSRLVTADKIGEWFRDALLERWGEDSLRGYLITCDYCVSIYVGPVVATVAVLWGDNRVIIIGLLALTASLFAGFLGAHE